MKLLICTQVMDQDHPVLGFFHRWVEEFAKHAEEIHVICLQKGKCTLPENVTVYSLGKEDGQNKFKYVYRFYKYFSKILFSHKISHVFFHMGAIYNILSFPFFLVRKKQNVKYLWWKAHGRINWFGKLALYFCDEVITSTATGFPIETDKRRIVGQAIDTNLFNKSEKIQREQNRVIFVGRIMPIKKIEVFLDVIRQLEDKSIAVEARIIGMTGDDSYYDELLQKVSNDHIDMVTFVGPLSQKELVVEYQKAGYFLNTSITHSMDKTVLEGVLCGCIPITGNRAFKELLDNTSLFVESNKSNDFFQTLKSIMNNDNSVTEDLLIDRVTTQHSLGNFTERVFRAT